MHGCHEAAVHAEAWTLMEHLHWRHSTQGYSFEPALPPLTCHQGFSEIYIVMHDI